MVTCMIVRLFMLWARIRRVYLLHVLNIDSLSFVSEDV